MTQWKWKIRGVMLNKIRKTTIAFDKMKPNETTYKDKTK